MKRLAWIFAATLLAFVALVVLAVALLPRDTLKARVGEQISAWTGRDVSLSGDPEIGFFPRLTVTLRDVRVAGPEGMDDAEVLSVARLRGTIRVLPLVIGRVEIGGFAMERPVVRLVRDEAGARNWAFDAGAAALQLAFAGDVPLGEFSIEEGTLLFEDRRVGTSERLDGLHLAITWPSVRRPLAIEGAARWRGEASTFAARAETPFAFLSGDATPLDAQLDSAPLALAFSGEAENGALVRLAGRLSVSTPSLKNFAGWVGSPLAAAPLGAARIAGEAVLHRRLLSVENAEVALDGNSGAGAVQIAVSGQTTVAGTLAFPALDLTPYLAGLSAGLDGGANWRSVGLDTDWFGDLAADLRLSADAVTIGALAFERAAASVILRDRRLEIGVAEAVFAGGGLTGDLTIADGDSPGAFAATAHFRGDALDLAALAGDAGARGAADISADLAGEGTDLGSAAASLTGTAALDATSGALPLPGLSALASSGTDGEIAPDEPAPFESLSATLRAEGGKAAVEGVLVSTDFAAEAHGTLDLADLRIDLKGGLTRAAPSPQTRPFSVGGTLHRPELAPLPQTE
jgi:AsmA protein